MAAIRFVYVAFGANKEPSPAAPFISRMITRLHANHPTEERHEAGSL
ncbi:hypothetical protein ACW9UM_18745 (plasmid) [Marinovum sp. KMM 9989]